jgi:ribosomal protein S18 acetylase RimI-like enzyme
MVKIHPITPAAAATFKAVRLRALRDSPSAFGSTYAREVLFSDEDWQRRAAQFHGERAIGFLAFDGDDPSGIVAAFLEEKDPAEAHLISMWVAPTHRRRGIGRLLVNVVIEWAQSKAAQTLHLMVTSSNDLAVRFYERLGFVKTGKTKPYPNDPSLIEYEMARRLGPGGVTGPSGCTGTT